MPYQGSRGALLPTGGEKELVTRNGRWRGSEFLLRYCRRLLHALVIHRRTSASSQEDPTAKHMTSAEAVKIAWSTPRLLARSADLLRVPEGPDTSYPLSRCCSKKYPKNLKALTSAPVEQAVHGIKRPVCQHRGPAAADAVGRLPDRPHGLCQDAIDTLLLPLLLLLWQLHAQPG